jgi:hypothetical protein
MHLLGEGPRLRRQLQASARLKSESYDIRKLSHPHAEESAINALSNLLATNLPLLPPRL